MKSLPFYVDECKRYQRRLDKFEKENAEYFI